MPLNQIPQWTEFLSCPVCYHEFNENIRRPISLGCGHTVCRTCLSQLQRKQCPFDQSPITQDIEGLPANYALLQLVGAEVTVEEQKVPANVISKYMKHYAEAKACIEELALYLKPLGLGGAGSNSCILSRPMQRKLVTLVNCQLVEEEGRSRAMRAARSLGERTVTELMLQHQNTQQLSANLWAAVRARGCQFLGPAMQEETLKLVLLALEDGAALSRKVLVMFVVQKLEVQFPQSSKTSVGHVVQLLYRASCFKVTKRNEESSLMQLKEEFRNYEALRREHDAQIVQIAMEGGLRISPEQWSSLLYGDLNHKSHMQSIIDKLQTPASFTSSIQELTIALQRSGDPANLGKLREHLKRLADINPNNELEPPAWEDMEYAMIATKIVVHGLVDFVSHHSHTKKILEQQQTQNIKYKTSMCRDVTQKGGCPRGNNCTFAHTEDELEKYRRKSRHMLSSINRQNSNQSQTGRSVMTPQSHMIPRGLSPPPPMKFSQIDSTSGQPSVDPGADDGLIEKKMTRELPTESPKKMDHHSPPDRMVDQREDIRYPTHSDVQIPYRPPVVHYDHHYTRAYPPPHGYPPGPPRSYPMHPPPPHYPYHGREPYDHPKDPPDGPYELPRDMPPPPHYRGHPHGDGYDVHPYYPEKEPHPPPRDSFPYESGARRDIQPAPPRYYPSIRHRYPGPSHHEYDRLHEADLSDGRNRRDDFYPPRDDLQSPHHVPSHRSHGPESVGHPPPHRSQRPEFAEHLPPHRPQGPESAAHPPLHRSQGAESVAYPPLRISRGPESVTYAQQRRYAEPESVANPASHRYEVAESSVHPPMHRSQGPETITYPPLHRYEDPESSAPPPRYYLEPRSDSPGVDKSDGLIEDGFDLNGRDTDDDDIELKKKQAAQDVANRQEREKVEKEKEKKRVDNYLQSIETPTSIPTNLVELQQRERVLVNLLNDHQIKTPWDQPAVTKLVSSTQGRPKSSSMVASHVDKYAESDQGKDYDPWTSTATLFDFRSFLKPEEGTKYTMTVRTSQIKHVSAKETEQMVLEKPHQGKEHPEFTQMNLNELKKTLEEVKQQDEKTGCTHFERTRELNKELMKRERMVERQNDHGHSTVTSYFQDDAYLSLWGPPVSRASRTSYNITPPIKVNAGPTGPGGVAPCTPVSINISNQMVPLAGQSPVADKNVDLFHRGILDVSSLQERHDEILPDRNQPNKEELEEMLAQVSTQIAKQKTVKTANDAFLIQRESRALKDTNLPDTSSVQQMEKDRAIAKRMQMREFQGFQEHNTSDRSPSDLRSSSPYEQPAFRMDDDFPPLSRESVNTQQSKGKHMMSDETRQQASHMPMYSEARLQDSQRPVYGEARQQSDMPIYSEARQQHSASGMPTYSEAYPATSYHSQVQRQHQQEVDDNLYARQLARDEARKAGVRLPFEGKGYGNNESYWPRS